MNEFKFFEVAGSNTLAMGLHYLFLAGLAWILCYVLFKQRWLHRKIVLRFPESADVRREIRYSCLSFLIAGLVAAGTVWASRQGWIQLYMRVADRGWTWFGPASLSPFSFTTRIFIGPIA